MGRGVNLIVFGVIRVFLRLREYRVGREFLGMFEKVVRA